MPQRLTETHEDYLRRSTVEANEAILRATRAEHAATIGAELYDGYATPRDAYEARVSVEERSDAWVFTRLILKLTFWWVWLPMALIRWVRSS
ncbi:MAG: hypothetical protein AAGA12_00050 [Pseudomonadota bacterium]